MPVHAVHTRSRSGDLKEAETVGSACSGPHGVEWADSRAKHRISVVVAAQLRARLERILALVASNQMPVIVTQYLNITEFEYLFLLGLFGTI
jgi:hypothetical protein